MFCYYLKRAVSGFPGFFSHSPTFSSADFDCFFPSCPIIHLTYEQKTTALSLQLAPKTRFLNIDSKLPSSIYNVRTIRVKSSDKSNPQGGQMIAVEIVNKTTAWTRPENCPAPNVQLAFVKIVEKHVAFLNPATTKIAMMYVPRDLRSECPCHNADPMNRESEHQNDKDKRPHYCGWEFEKNDNILQTTHFPVDTLDEKETEDSFQEV